MRILLLDAENGSCRFGIITIVDQPILIGKEVNNGGSGPVLIGRWRRRHVIFPTAELSRGKVEAREHSLGLMISSSSRSEDVSFGAVKQGERVRIQSKTPSFFHKIAEKVRESERENFYDQSTENLVDLLERKC